MRPEVLVEELREVAAEYANLADDRRDDAVRRSYWEGKAVAMEEAAWRIEEYIIRKADEVH